LKSLAEFFHAFSQSSSRPWTRTRSTPVKIPSKHIILKRGVLVYRNPIRHANRPRLRRRHRRRRRRTRRLHVKQRIILASAPPVPRRLCRIRNHHCRWASVRIETGRLLWVWRRRRRRRSRATCTSEHARRRRHKREYGLSSLHRRRVEEQWPRA